MLSPEDSRRALRRLFRERCIADLKLLFRVLDTSSPRSVFRRLSPLGYRSSYSHAGAYYTLDDVPKFDANGLWQYQGVFFSQDGTLKSTVARMVEGADAGFTHRELRAQLRVHVHNTLLDLVKGKRIGRQLLDGLFLYVSAVQDRADAQLSRRRQESDAAARHPLLSGQPLEVVVLLEIIHGAQSIPAPSQVVARLTAKGLRVSAEEIEVLFHKHGLKKTLGFRSRSSRR